MEGKLILGKKDFFSLLMTVPQYAMTDASTLYTLNVICGSDFNC